MFIDASVVVAILNKEEGYSQFIKDMEDHGGKFYYSPLVTFEATAAIARSRSGRHRPDGQQFGKAHNLIQKFFASLEATEITITPTVGDRAINAAGKYGKFVGHDADLNFGDCYSYACASAYCVPLLYKGDDFAKTDLA